MNNSPHRPQFPLQNQPRTATDTSLAAPRVDICRAVVVGIGYVGWPLVSALAPYCREIVAFDINAHRINLLKQTSQVVTRDNNPVHFTSDASDINDAELYFVTVPTPVTPNNTPDLNPLRQACIDIGRGMKTGAVVIFETTVYPGATEQFCAPLLEQHAHMKVGVDFTIGYAPERINPGDQKHTIGNTHRIIAAKDQPTLKRMRSIYGAIHNNHVIDAPSIRHAEAAKLVENCQRDVNIAFANEMSGVLRALDLDATSVFSLAASKWNFLPFKPGLVGGHCISVDPWYLIHAANTLGMPLALTQQARETNEQFANHIAHVITERIPQGRILVVGLTYKNNVADCRNSRIFDVIVRLLQREYDVQSYDPLITANTIHDPLVKETLTDTLSDNYHAIILATTHTCMHALNIPTLVHPHGWIFDIQSDWPQLNHQHHPHHTTHLDTHLNDKHRDDKHRDDNHLDDNHLDDSINAYHYWCP